MVGQSTLVSMRERIREVGLNGLDAGCMVVTGLAIHDGMAGNDIIGAVKILQAMLHTY
jgi:hypothetical protein